MNELNNILLIAHRGANKLAPENTIKSFQKAIQLKADYIEFDTHLSKDGEIVIMHDDDTSRTTGYKGKISEMTLEELKQLDCGEGERIPTLNELIDLAKGKIGLQLEIKAKGQANKIVSLLKENNLTDTTIISSFDHDELLEVQKLDPKLKLAPLVIGVKKNTTIQEAIDNNFYAIHPLYRFVTQKFLQKAHENNIKVNVWTVDSKSKIKKLVYLGVDGIITNDLETANKVLKRS